MLDPTGLKAAAIQPALSSRFRLSEESVRVRETASGIRTFPLPDRTGGSAAGKS